MSTPRQGEIQHRTWCSGPAPRLKIDPQTGPVITCARSRSQDSAVKSRWRPSPEYDRLGVVLRELEDREIFTPCMGTDRNLWIADDFEIRQQAIARCSDCPAIKECRAAADASGAAWGIWGGQDFSENDITERARVRARARKTQQPRRRSS